MPGKWVVAASIAEGAYNTSHIAECPDIAPVECAAMTIPDHEHHVRLRLIRTDLTATYGIRENLGVSLRVPYDVKAQRVRYTTLDGAPFVPPYGDIHHRSETLRGIADGDLLLLWSPSPEWRLGFGTTLPIGSTVADPVRLGLEGKKHDHIQFGIGLPAPEVDIAWAKSVVSGAIQATWPIGTNSKGFRAPQNLRWSVGPTFTAGKASFGISAAGQYQTIGRWHGVIDEGTGFSNGGLRAHATFSLGSVSITPSVYSELYSHGSQCGRPRDLFAGDDDRPHATPVVLSCVCR